MASKCQGKAKERRTEILVLRKRKIDGEKSKKAEELQRKRDKA